MYIYKDYEKIQRKKRIIWAFITFIFAILGSYLVQTYLTSRMGTEGKNEVERLSNISNVKINTNETKKQEDIIDEAMKSVVGISVIKANEESIFDISVVEKWGLRNGDYSI